MAGLSVRMTCGSVLCQVCPMIYPTVHTWILWCSERELGAAASHGGEVAIDYTLINSLHIIYSLPGYLPGSIHALPGYWGVPQPNLYILG